MTPMPIGLPFGSNSPNTPGASSSDGSESTPGLTREVEDPDWICKSIRCRVRAETKSRRGRRADHAIQNRNLPQKSKSPDY